MGAHISEPSASSIVFQDKEERANKAYLGTALLKVVTSSRGEPSSYAVVFGRWNDRPLDDDIVRHMKNDFVSDPDGCLSRRYPISICISEVDIANRQELVKDYSEASLDVPELQLATSAPCTIYALSGHHRAVASEKASVHLARAVEKAKLALGAAIKQGVEGAEMEKCKAQLHSAERSLDRVERWAVEVFSNGETPIPRFIKAST